MAHEECDSSHPIATFQFIRDVKRSQRHQSSSRDEMPAPEKENAAGFPHELPPQSNQILDWRDQPARHRADAAPPVLSGGLAGAGPLAGPPNTPNPS